MSGFIPLLALGIPTGPVLSIVLAALIIQGSYPAR
jgi:TctA family transporter